MSHTEGPWQCSRSTDGLLVSKKTGEAVAQFKVAPLKEDAALIAAAPTLLAALIEAAELIESTGLDASLARAAIAEAKGE